MKYDIEAEELVSLPERVETSDYATVNVTQGALAFNIAGMTLGQVALAGNLSSVNIYQ